MKKRIEFYTDQELDSEANLYNYDARLYDPIIGRFLSADSVVPQWKNPQSLNRYSYCINNPLLYIDPTGHFWQELKNAWLYFDWVKDEEINRRIEAGEIKHWKEQWKEDTRARLVEAAPEVMGFDNLPEENKEGVRRTLWAHAYLMGGEAGVWSKAAGTVGAVGKMKVFWSGEGALEAATKFALKNGGETLEMTARGEELMTITKGMDWFTEGRPLWVEASKDFAGKATGTVHAFQSSKGVSLNSIWKTEFSILKDNGVNIIYHIIP